MERLAGHGRIWLVRDRSAAADDAEAAAVALAGEHAPLEEEQIDDWARLVHLARGCRPKTSRRSRAWAT